MASIEESLFSRLSGYAGLSALVSSRVYPDHLPQNPTLPAVVYERVTTERNSVMGVDTDVVAASFEVSSYAFTFAEANNVATQVLGALQRFSGTVGGIVFLDCFVVDEDQDFDSDLDDQGQGMYIKILDFQIWHRE